jgi:hypothetical protein
MNPISTSSLAGLFLLLGSVANAGTTVISNHASAQGEPAQEWLSASLSVGYESLHVYRGADSSSGEPIVWEALDFDLFQMVRFNLYHGNSFNGEYGELTPSFSIHGDFGSLTAAAGMIWYHFPGEDGIDSEEYFLSLKGNLGSGFSASAWASYNARGEGWYHEAKLYHLYEFTAQVKLETSAALGYSHHYRSGGDGFDNLTFAIGLPVAMTPSLTVKPLIGYAFALDALDRGDESWAGLTLNYKF